RSRGCRHQVVTRSSPDRRCGDARGVGSSRSWHGKRIRWDNLREGRILTRRRKLGAAVALAACLVLATAASAARQSSSAKPAPAPAAGCQLGEKGKIKHVVYIQFDNVHFERDNPNVPSDLEQMPHLLNFIRDNGTLDTNDHTILISHTGGGILSSLTGLYPDRQGQGVSNSYGYFRPDGSVGISSSFKYWTDTTDRRNPPHN